MASVTPLLVMVAFALIHGIALTPAAAQDCDAGKIVVTEGQTRVIGEIQESGSHVSLDLYVKPKPDFEGFSVIADGGDDTHFTAWFTATIDCFPRDDPWHQLNAFASIDSAERHLKLGFKIGRCVELCEKNISVASLHGLNVSALGTSEWLLTKPPAHCDVIKVDPSRPIPDPSACLDPPPPSTHTATFPVWAWVLVALLIVGVVAAVVVAAVLIYRKN